MLRAGVSKEVKARTGWAARESQALDSRVRGNDGKT